MPCSAALAHAGALLILHADVVVRVLVLVLLPDNDDDWTSDREGGDRKEGVPEGGGEWSRADDSCSIGSSVD